MVLIREYFDLALVIVGVYVIYFSLVTFAADGMFDAVPFLLGCWRCCLSGGAL